MDGSACLEWAFSVDFVSWNENEAFNIVGLCALEQHVCAEYVVARERDWIAKWVVYTLDGKN